MKQNKQNYKKNRFLTRHYRHCLSDQTDKPYPKNSDVLYSVIKCKQWFKIVFFLFFPCFNRITSFTSRILMAYKIKSNLVIMIMMILYKVLLLTNFLCYVTLIVINYIVRGHRYLAFFKCNTIGIKLKFLEGIIWFGWWNQ